jgi:hypothetical protein
MVGVSVSLAAASSLINGPAGVPEMVLSEWQPPQSAERSGELVGANTQTAASKSSPEPSEQPSDLPSGDLDSLRALPLIELVTERHSVGE